MLSLSKLRYVKLTSFRTAISIANHSTARPTVIVQASIENENIVQENIKTDSLPRHTIQKVKEIRSSNLVAAAFASLHEEENKIVPKQRPSFADKKISKATTLNDLLTIADDNIISRQTALKIVSTLAQWSTSGKVQLSDFETDPRFIKLCRLLSRNNGKSKLAVQSSIRGDDLSMVLGVTGDDEAAKLVASITLPQMIKVMSTLAHKKRRSTPLLRSLAYNISRNSTKLDLKQSADLLYSMSVLNFPEPVLMERITNDVIACLESNTDRSAVIGSLLTSIGFLRYRDTSLIDALSEWILKYYKICRSQDISALFQTLAVLNYHPPNFEQLEKDLIPTLNITDVPKITNWLDIVWSLVLLNKASTSHISSVLSSEFINKLQETSSLNSSTKAKLLNINAAANLLIPDYKGAKIDDSNSSIKNLLILRTKEKQQMVMSMLDSLGSLFSSNTCLKSTINTGMGFLIDGECVLDKKCNPVPLAKAEQNSDHIRIAILAFDYHDFCRGDDQQPNGANALAMRLLEAQGYKLMIVPHTDFSSRDKLVQRVQYLEKQLKLIASSA